MSIRRLILLAALLLSPAAFACSVSAGFVPFEPDVEPASEGVRLPAPQVSVHSVRRASWTDRTSCADLAFLSLQVPDDALGYRFELVEGDLDFDLPRGFIAPEQPGFIGFAWVEPRSVVPLPIRAVLRITAMSSAGQRSEPQLLRLDL